MIAYCTNIEAYLSAMKTLVIFLLIACSLCVEGNEKQQQQQAQVAKTAAALASPEIAAAIEILKSIKELRPETSNTIQSFHESSGYESLTSGFDQTTGSIKYAKIKTMIDFWLSSSVFNALGDANREKVKRHVQEYFIIDENVHFSSKTIQIEIHMGHGEVTLFQITLTPGDSGMVNYAKTVFSAKFRPAKKFVVTRTSDCDIFACDTYDNIIYLDTAVTREHIMDIYNIYVDMLLRLNEFLRK